MSYKDVSQVGTHAPCQRSEQSTRIRTNAEIFEARGMPWHGDLPEKTPRLSPDGKLKMSPRAHLENILHPPQQSVPHTGLAGASQIGRDHDNILTEDDPELSQFLAPHCEPIAIRLARERNTLVPSMTRNKLVKSMQFLGGQPVASRSLVDNRQRSPLLSAAAKIRQIRAHKNVKVKS